MTANMSRTKIEHKTRSEFMLALKSCYLINPKEIIISKIQMLKNKQRHFSQNYEIPYIHSLGGKNYEMESNPGPLDVLITLPTKLVHDRKSDLSLIVKSWHDVILKSWWTSLCKFHKCSWGAFGCYWKKINVLFATNNDDWNNDSRNLQC